MRRLAGGLIALLLAAAPAAVLALTSNPNDPFYRDGYQWALSGNASSTNAPQAWCVSTGSGILIADIDTGVDFGHPDLQGRVVAGANFTSGNGDPSTPDGVGAGAVSDDYGHGTMTTGIMVASTNNGYGMAAEAPGARALVMKVFSYKSGVNAGYKAYDNDVAAAIYWAVDKGASVVNLSLGGDLPSNSLVATATGDPIPQAIQWAANSGAAVAIAAGNGAFDSGIAPPAGSYTDLAQYALVVGAMGPAGQVASYSQNGVGVNIYAPGGDSPNRGGDPKADILSTFPVKISPSGPYQPMTQNVTNAPYALYDGTSFSTPYAAGTLALLMAHGYNASQARSRILSTAKSVGGVPVLDAAAALGSCPSSGGGGGSGSAGGGGCCPTASGGATSPQQVSAGAPGPASPAAKAAQPSTAPSAGASPAALAPPGAGPATVHPPALRSAPRALVLSLIGLGALCVLGALAWFLRVRVFTQP